MHSLLEGLEYHKRGLADSDILHGASCLAQCDLIRVDSLRAYPALPLKDIHWGESASLDGAKVSIYVGGGAVIHAPHTGGVVEYISLSYFQGAVRPG